MISWLKYLVQSEPDPPSAEDPQAPSEPQRRATCPNCWAMFPANDAFFIAAHPELVGDPILGEHVPKRLAPKEVRF